MQKLIFRNGAGTEINLTSGDYGITDWSGFSADGLNIQSQQVPFQDGAVFLDALMEQRELSVTVAMNAKNDLEKRYRLRREMISALNPKLGEGVLIYTNNFLSKQIHVVPQLPVFQNNNSNDSGNPKVSCSFTACSPYWEDLEETVIDIDENEEVQIVNGGDVPVQIEADISVNGEDLLLRNLTNGKNIGIDGYHDWNIIINTNLGKKSAERQVNAVSYQKGGQFNSILAVKDKMYLVGTQFITIDIDGKQGTISINEIYPIYDITYSEELNMFALCGGGSSAGSGYIYTSNDGYIWTKQTIPSSKRLNLISYEDGKFKASYYDSGFKYITSTDGINWISETTTINKNNAKIYRNNLYIRVNGYDIQTSPDNTNWTTVFSLPQTVQGMTLISLCYFWGNYYFVGTNGIILKSKDLINFIYYQEIFDGYNVVKFSKSENYLYAFMRNGINKTQNLIQWNYISSPSSEAGVSFIAINDDILIATFQGDAVYRSTNGGVSFSPLSLPNDSYTVDYDGTNVFLCGMSHLYISSDNGATFSQLGNIIIESVHYYAVKVHRFKNAYFILAYIDGAIGIIKTTDFQTYTLLFSNSVSGGYSDISMGTNFTSNDNVLVYAVDKFYVMSTDGINFVKKDISSLMLNYDSLWSCAIINNTLWLCGQVEIFITTDYIHYTKIPSLFIQYYNYCITQFDNKVLLGGNTGESPAIASYKAIENENIINELSISSDMGFNLAKGENSIILNLSDGTASGVIKYRQKYIGV